MRRLSCTYIVIVALPRVPGESACSAVGVHAACEAPTTLGWLALTVANGFNLNGDAAPCSMRLNRLDAEMSSSSLVAAIVP